MQLSTAIPDAMLCMYFWLVMEPEGSSKLRRGPDGGRAAARMCAQSHGTVLDPSPQQAQAVLQLLEGWLLSLSMFTSLLLQPRKPRSARGDAAASAAWRAMTISALAEGPPQDPPQPPLDRSELPGWPPVASVPPQPPQPAGGMAAAATAVAVAAAPMPPNRVAAARDSLPGSATGPARYVMGHLSKYPASSQLCKAATWQSAGSKQLGGQLYMMGDSLSYYLLATVVPDLLSSRLARTAMAPPTVIPRSQYLG